MRTIIGSVTIKSGREMKADRIQETMETWEGLKTSLASRRVWQLESLVVIIKKLLVYMYVSLETTTFSVKMVTSF